MIEYRSSLSIEKRSSAPGYGRTVAAGVIPPNPASAAPVPKNSSRTSTADAEEIAREQVEWWPK